MTKLNRRLFIVSGLAAAGAVTVPNLAGAASSRPRAAAGDPFGLGVASGEPRSDGMVLWTRLAPKPLDIGGGMGDRTVAVEWEVATDEAFGNVVASGTEQAVPGEGHSVHAEPKGLQAGAEFFYRFRADGFISPVGRTRSAPAAGSTPSSVKFTMASCQHFEEGWYHAHHFMAQDDPDLVLFLGDYMYEKQSGRDDTVRGYVDFDEVDNLAEYRLRYAQTKLDPGLKAAHAAAPWLVVFDDHELANNWWGDGSGWPATRKQASFQAYWENMPLPKAMKPTSPAIPLYRRFQWGTLARFHMMDTRQYRWKQAPSADCDEIRREDRTLTGAAQEQWLLDGLAQGGTRWDLLGQQVFFASRDDDGAESTCDLSEDSWDGYQASRRRITQGWVDRQVRNPVVLTGDVHRHWANSLRLDYFDTDSPYVGAELVTSSVTSGGDPGSSDPPPDYVENGPHLNYVGNQRGYVRVTANASELSAEFMRVSSVSAPDPVDVTLGVHERFTVLDGVPGLR
ncbi:alkaline phosphatase D family protein [Actinophytocola gossypii]|uniref:Alkaline phosphatase D family protein n=1 Tax=Actinophytocola gossypii TaxID=2812003 RepID=A0ABT2JFH4_9PSEU|nr:alkaline phosphatase D family protein [Actinophytocola gossypii]MCT2586627.1 alkaline phosphatase D family protein [Actinophytocola gossypii]